MSIEARDGADEVRPEAHDAAAVRRERWRLFVRQNRIEPSITTIFLVLYAVFIVGAPEVYTQLGIYRSFMSTLPFMGVMYTPQRRPNLEVIHLTDERLVLVSSEGRHEGPDAGYIHVDYGPEFSVQHSVRYPDFAGPALAVNVGWLGLRCLLARGGSGYFPLRLVRPLIAEGRLALVEDAPEFSLPAYVVHPTEPHGALVTDMRDALLGMVAPHD